MPRGKRITYDEETDTYYLGDNWRYYKRLFRQFREEFPSLWEYGTIWEPHGYREIRIHIPTKGVLFYNEVGTSGGKIVWDKLFLNKRVQRELMYEEFIDELKAYQEAAELTQGELAEMSGVSRKKMNEYLNGRSIPKISTMEKIAEELGLHVKRKEFIDE